MMIRFHPGRIAVGTMLISLALQVTPATGAQESPKQKPSAEQANVSDKELGVFVKAYVETQKIRLAHEAELKNSRDAEESQKIQREGNSKLQKALEKHGLTVQSYNRIFSAVNGNEELRKKALKLIEQERKNP